MYRAFDGEDVKLDAFNDPDQKKLGADQVSDGHDKAAELASVDEAAEAHLARHGHSQPPFIATTLSSEERRYRMLKRSKLP